MNRHAGFRHRVVMSGQSLRQAIAPATPVRPVASLRRLPERRSTRGVRCIRSPGRQFMSVTDSTHLNV